ncbi:TfoX/Sxy family protein [Pontibacterium sp.]|uniref:TfoX/Sxy family protein n=1 Tax=Pontibacterium sp. TaxID=2036026 RepID=UPI00351177D2
MANSDDFISYVVDSMHMLGPVQAKRMFGGHGLFLGGLMFALVADDQLYLKSDPQTETRYKAHDLERFTYMKKGKPCHLNYYQAPEECLDNSEELVEWSAMAYQVAVRAAS